MIDSLLLFGHQNPIISALVVCYLLTFITVRQVKPFLEYLCAVIEITWLPADLKKRWFLRIAVFICGASVSLIVTSGLIVFECCSLSWLQAGYIAGSVGLLAPMVYDGAMLSLSLFEALGIIRRSFRARVERWLDPTKEQRKQSR